MLAVVGPKWTGSAKKGSVDIHRENDWVRLEVEGALKRSNLVIPVLVDNAQMPKASELPDGLKDFAYRNAAPVSGGKDFHTHIDQLIRSIDRSLAEIRVPPQTAQNIALASATEVEDASAPVTVEQEFLISADPISAAAVPEPDSTTEPMVATNNEGDKADADPTPSGRPVERDSSVIYNTLDPIRDEVENADKDNPISTSTAITAGVLQTVLVDGNRVEKSGFASVERELSLRHKNRFGSKFLPR